MTEQLQRAFCAFTRRQEHTHEGALQHLAVWNHLAWLFGNELRMTRS